jgi:hypothetical protein
MKTGTALIPSMIRIFKQYKELADKAIAQAGLEGIHWKPEPESNSIYLVMKHMSGNMKSRWTDFLTTDGEKEWRNRDSEFEDNNVDLATALTMWKEGWACLFNALEPLSEADLARIVHIRSEPHSVMEAINRQIAHYAYHTGQIVYIAKAYRSTEWQTLSIARGQSGAFNDNMNKR